MVNPGHNTTSIKYLEYYNETIPRHLTHIWSLFPSYTNWKHQETFKNTKIIFSEGI